MKWPTLMIEDRVQAAVRWVAGFELPEMGTAGTLAVRAEDAAMFASDVISQRLAGMALAAIGDGSLEAPSVVRDRLEHSHRQWMLQDLALERRLLAVTEALEEAGIPSVVVKGPAVAHTFYPDPSWRAFGDIDILIRGREWDRAMDLLTGLGLRRKQPEPRSGFTRRFGKGATFESDDGFEADVHRTLAPGAFGLWLDPDELFERSVWFALGGMDLRRLDDTGAFFHACLHASLGMRVPMRMPVRDVVQIAAEGKVDWAVIEDWATRWRMRPVFRHAMTLAASLFGAPWPVEARRALVGPTGRRERRAILAYTTDRRGRGGTARVGLSAITGVRAKAAYLRALVLPSREFLAWRAGEGNRTSYVRRWLIPLRWLVGRRR